MLTGLTACAAVVAGLVVVAMNAHSPLIGMRQLLRRLSSGPKPLNIVAERDMLIERCLEEYLVHRNPQSQQ